MNADNLQAIIDEAWMWREHARLLDLWRKRAVGRHKSLLARAQQLMEDAGVPKMGTGFANASISEQTLPTDVDWEAVHEHIKETDDWSLLKRQLNPGVYRELLKVDEELATKLATPLTQTSINLKTKPGV